MLWLDIKSENIAQSIIQHRGLAYTNTHIKDKTNSIITKRKGGNPATRAHKTLLKKQKLVREI